MFSLLELLFGFNFNKSSLFDELENFLKTWIRCIYLDLWAFCLSWLCIFLIKLVFVLLPFFFTMKRSLMKLFYFSYIYYPLFHTLSFNFKYYHPI